MICLDIIFDTTRICQPDFQGWHLFFSTEASTFIIHHQKPRISIKNLKKIVDACLSGSPKAQRKLFDTFYSEGLNIAHRYSSNDQDAKEILSNAFIRAFDKLHLFNPAYPFIPWFRTLIVHCSSDYYRYQKDHYRVDIQEYENQLGFEEGLIQQLSYEEILKAVQTLPPAYRLAFNMYEIDGYKHHEIAQTLGISVGTSKSNLAKAKQKLKVIFVNRWHPKTS